MALIIFRHDSSKKLSAKRKQNHVQKMFALKALRFGHWKTTVALLWFYFHSSFRPNSLLD